MSLDSVEMPDDVRGAEKMMQDSLMKRERMFTLLTEAEMPIHTFLKHLNHPSEEEMGTAMTKDYNSMIASLNGLLEELKVTEKDSNAFWSIHKARIDHFLRICHFKKSANKVRRLGKGKPSEERSCLLVTGESVVWNLLCGYKDLRK